MLLHKSEASIHNLVQEYGNTNKNHTYNDCKDHLIRLSLLNTLLPNVVLHTGLLSTSRITKVDDILDQSFIDALETHSVHV